MCKDSSRLCPLGLLLGTGTLLGQQHCLDVGQDTALGNGNTSQELVQLLIVPEYTSQDSFRARIAKSPDGKL